MTLVSIAIVAHNNWPDLELAIESALNQSWKSTEVIVIDNESTDGTEAGILHRFEGRVRYVRQRNTLDGGGYNRGLAESNGDFIQLLDGDDFIAPNKIARQIEVFRARRDADIVYGETRQFQGEAGTPAWSDWDTGPQDDMLATLLDPRGEGAGLVIHSALFRRRVFERVGPWDESLVGADFDYWLRCAWAGCVFAFSPGAWCFHRRRPRQMSSDHAAMVNRTVKTLEKALRYIDREPYRSMASARLAGLIYGSAMTDLTLDRAAAIETLRTARQLAPSRIGSVPYALGYAAASVPGFRALIKLPVFADIRRTVGRKLGMLDS